MIKQIKYFQAVVRYQSFTRAADECFISQSAISQQIQALENDLGVRLINRERRKFSLTPAGEFFYQKSLVLVSDFDRLCAETRRLAKGVEHELIIGYLRHYGGQELRAALANFSVKFPEVFIQLTTGTHEELYDKLRTGRADVVINDLRRKPSEQYINYFLVKSYFYAELPLNNPLSQLEQITMDDLKNTPAIIIAPLEQRNHEELFCREYFGVKGDFLFAENLSVAHLMAAANKGYFLADSAVKPEASNLIANVPIFHNDKQLYRKYYAFWRANTTKKYIEEFAEILKAQFTDA